MSYVEALQSENQKGLKRRQRREKKEARDLARARKIKDEEEAAQRIKEANGARGKIRSTARMGLKEVQVCVLRGGIHFEPEFRSKQSPKYLGRIGKIIRQHFIDKGLKVSFRYWRDGMRCDELDSDTGYEMIVSW